MKKKIKDMALGVHDRMICIVMFGAVCLMALAVNAVAGFQWLCGKAWPEKRAPVSLPPKTEAT